MVRRIQGARAARGLLGPARAAASPEWRAYLDERTVAMCESEREAPGADDEAETRAPPRRRAYATLDAILRGGGAI